MSLFKKRYKNENDLHGNVKVIYENEEYITGNRRHDLVELYKDNKFIKVVKIKEVYSKRIIT